MARMSCGEATMRLLARYGVRAVFGVPGVHTLEFCRGLRDPGTKDDGRLLHIQTRNEEGAAYAAEGWARATGEPGVALVISGPGVTNAATGLGDAWCASLPMLLISAEPPSDSLGKGWGVLHEITEQRAVTAPLTAFSATAHRPEDVPGLLARAFTLFSSARPRPVHISIPTDVQAMPVDEEWEAVTLPARPVPEARVLAEAAERLAAARRPVIVAGGGAVEAGKGIADLSERLAAPVITTTAGKGIVPCDGPLALGGGLSRAAGRELLARADVVLALGTELSETDSFVPRLDIPGEIIRVDIDPAKLNDLYPAQLGLVGDAAAAAEALADRLAAHRPAPDAAAARQAEVSAARAETLAPQTDSEARHLRLLSALREVLPDEAILSGDACQPVYTAAFAWPARRPRRFFFPAGFCTLGAALPQAIGAKLAEPETPVVALVGDGGFMFTMPELLTAAQLGLALPVILWDNRGLKQIRDDLAAIGVQPVGVDPLNPDFTALARACHCHAAAPDDEVGFRAAVTAALAADRPTLIHVTEGAGWLA
ncbi:5-guanidino-2-oxopentanoate decarboxylase [Meinhardsimonia xiamenensis]|jgi:thiamine pyrophosphate-dependent acetolactate synthase large subunit-like protein|uniref:5-guanidino-2-oxopentanoate decarboxylase n=1 Tax=Meinhardsimonia xiamenensis TaxID=990712 RepID=A0A1G9BB66_9RHOB|nr:5-guanidino-2-oxopentanoate decarboxylase [Meinhardsimonia xiamenensis]PRX35047.1 5-guanidino-2-oxopentanoate decarboxylase [Meinhardsimonia xiamenensis]SDK36699.1 5-guanidino-2-oxopentanoate decarboxylase [Meinhardsimonia xiamenensis]